MSQPRIFVSEVDYATLIRSSDKSGIFNPVDRDDVKSAKKLAEAGLFEAVCQRQLSGRNKTVFKLTEDGQKIYDFRRGIIRQAFEQIADRARREAAADWEAEKAEMAEGGL